VLVTLLIAFFLGSSGGHVAGSTLVSDPARLQSALRHHVKDSARLTQLEALITELKEVDKAVRARLKGEVETLGETAARQASTPSELDAAIDALEASHLDAMHQKLLVRLRLAALTTPEEWTAITAEIFPPRTSPSEG
jgi:hypothetical protein